MLKRMNQNQIRWS